MSQPAPTDYGRDEVMFRLPCHFVGQESEGLTEALARTRSYFLTRMSEETSERLPHRLYQIARCLRDANEPRTALEVMEWIADPAQRFDVLARVAADEMSQPPFTAERRMIRAALELADRHDLWGHEAVRYLAAGTERIDQDVADRIFESVTLPADRVRAITYVMQSYCPATSIVFRGFDDCVAVRR